MVLERRQERPEGRAFEGQPKEEGTTLECMDKRLYERMEERQVVANAAVRLEKMLSEGERRPFEEVTSMLSDQELSEHTLKTFRLVYELFWKEYDVNYSIWSGLSERLGVMEAFADEVGAAFFETVTGVEAQGVVEARFEEGFLQVFFSREEDARTFENTRGKRAAKYLSHGFFVRNSQLKALSGRRYNDNVPLVVVNDIFTHSDPKRTAIHERQHFIFSVLQSADVSLSQYEFPLRGSHDRDP